MKIAPMHDALMNAFMSLYTFHKLKMPESVVFVVLCSDLNWGKSC